MDQISTLWVGANRSIYGKITLNEINARLQDLATELGAELIIQQSNHEGVLVDSVSRGTSMM